MRLPVCCRLLLVGGLALPTLGLAQPRTKPAPALAEFKRNFALIEASTEGESDAADSLHDATVKKLVAYLKTHDLSAAEAKYIGLGWLAAPDAAQLRVYTYSYSSGGTRGPVNHPVMQWRNAAGRRFAYALDVEGNFAEVYPLASPGRKLYLLLGAEKGNSVCERGLAYVVELKGDYLVLDNKVFGPEPLLDICNVTMTYGARSQTLRVAAAPEFGPPGEYRGKPFRPFTLQFAQERFVPKR